MARHIVAGALQRLVDAGAGGAQQLGIDRELTAVADGHAGVLRLIGVEHRRDVVLGVAGGEQHARHGEHVGHAAFAQLVETVADDRSRELEEAELDIPSRQALSDTTRQRFELGHGVGIAAAVAAQHDARLVRHRRPSIAPD